MADENNTSTQDEKDEIVEETQEEQQEESTDEEVIEEAEETEEEEEDPRPSRRDERIQDLVETNKMLRKLIETRTFTPHAQEVDVDIPAFEDADVEKAFNAKLNKERQRMQGQLGAVAEELDATRFDRVLVKEGIDEDSPEYEKITTALQTYREDQASQGHYFKRADAYAILKTKGVFKTKAKKDVKKVTVVKTKPHVAIQRSTNKSAKPVKDKGNFKSLSLDDKEKALENAKF
jgi:hypothetical protein